jgi:hypothetical protein
MSFAQHAESGQGRKRTRCQIGLTLLDQDDPAELAAVRHLVDSVDYTTTFVARVIREETGRTPDAAAVWRHRNRLCGCRPHGGL